MPDARFLRVLLFATIWVVSACVSVAPPAQTGSPVALPTDSSAKPTTESVTTDAPADEPTLAPEPTEGTPTEPTEGTATEPTEGTATEPTEGTATEPTEPTATDLPNPTDAPQIGAFPNLRVQKFEPDQEPVVVGVAAKLTADITNYADAAAGSFMVQFVLAKPGDEELILDTQTVDRLGAGAATQLTVSVTPDVAGGLSVFARVDPTDQLKETDESDNEKVLEIVAEQTEINLTLPADGLTVFVNPDAPRVPSFTIAMTNSGQSTLTGPMSVKYFGYNGAGDYVEWGTFDFEIDLAPGAPFNQQVAWTVDPGTYRAYALVDSGQTWAETKEDDNEAFFDFTAP